ncbi:MAG: enoyl-CoA hydratase-related protein [Syntrophales bacterium]|nr:enoyl-CoA hydratase-related protein [Syntrophales bacterium]
MGNSEVVVYEKRDSIAIVTINRPEALNALNTEVNVGLLEALYRAEAESDISVVILKGSGGKAFIAGADIREMMDKNPMEAREYALAAKKVVDKIWNLRKPVIAAINGYCLGGGLEYALACDLRTATEKSRFGLPEINLGIMPGSAGTQRLSRIIGITRAKELCFLGEMIEAQKALKIGLINYIFPEVSFLEDTIALAEKIAMRSPHAITLIKSAINKGLEMDLESASLFEIDCFALCFSTEEQKSKMRDFVNKKKTP